MFRFLWNITKFIVLAYAFILVMIFVGAIMMNVMFL